MQTGSNKQRDRLITQYEEYVQFVVGRMVYSMRLPKDRFDEFVAAGNLGLVEAAQRFDFKSGRDFKSYAFLRIRGAIIDSIRECSDLSGEAYQYSKALQAAHELRMTEYEQTIREEVGQEDEEKLKRFLDLAAKGALAFRLSLADAEEELAEISSDEPDPEEVFVKKSHHKRLHFLIGRLPLKERKIIKDYYFRNLSFTQIAKANPGMSKSWVSRLHSRAITLLKESYVAEV